MSPLLARRDGSHFDRDVAFWGEADMHRSVASTRLSRNDPKPSSTAQSHCQARPGNLPAFEKVSPRRMRGSTPRMTQSSGCRTGCRGRETAGRDFFIEALNLVPDFLEDLVAHDLLD